MCCVYRVLSITEYADSVYTITRIHHTKNPKYSGEFCMHDGHQFSIAAPSAHYGSAHGARGAAARGARARRPRPGAVFPNVAFA